MMLIDLNDLRERGRPLQVSCRFTEDELRVQNTVVHMDGPADCELMVSFSGQELHVSGTVTAALVLTCCRCLKQFPHRVHKQVDLEYLPDPVVEREGEELELNYEDLDVGFYRNDKFDLAAVVSEQVIFDIPMKVVCRADCKGLCDQCGIDLNEGECGCSKDRVDPRLEILAELRKRIKH